MKTLAAVICSIGRLFFGTYTAAVRVCKLCKLGISLFCSQRDTLFSSTQKILGY
jgi:hypothetical protein